MQKKIKLGLTLTILMCSTINSLAMDGGKCSPRPQCKCATKTAPCVSGGPRQLNTKSGVCECVFGRRNS